MIDDRQVNAYDMCECVILVPIHDYSVGFCQNTLLGQILFYSKVLRAIQVLLVQVA